MLTPALSVILSKLICKEKLGDLYLKPNFMGNIKWYLAAYFLTPVIAYSGAAVYFLIFRSDFDMLGSRYALEAGITDKNEYISELCIIIPLAILVNPLIGIIQCFGEELAWRGFLLPRLNKVFTTGTAVILNGVIWGLWHSPIIAMGFNYRTTHPVRGIFAMIAFCTVCGIISSFLFYKTNSVWCSVLFHASINGMDKWSPSLLFMSREPDRFIGPDQIGIIGGIGYVILALMLFPKLRKFNSLVK